MMIGITYDLREEYLSMGFSEEETAEFDRVDTIEGIEAAIRHWGHETERIGHLRNLVTRLAEGSRWDLVFNIAEGMYGLSREAQVPALLEAYRIPFTFSDARVLILGLHKANTKQLLRDAGLATPAFHLVEQESDIPRVALAFPLFAKPVAEGTGKGIHPHSKIQTPDQLDAVCRELLRTFRQPVLVETFLPGREVTVGIAGTGPDARVLGVMEVLLRSTAESDVYSFTNKAQYEGRVDYALVEGPLAEEAGALALAAYRTLGCRDAGRIDLRADADGRMSVIELNPLAGLNPVHSDLPILCRLRGISFDDLIGQILASAIRRVEAGE